MLEIIVITLLISQLFSLYWFFRIKQHNKKMMKLYDIGQKITSNIKFNALLEEIMELVKAETSAQSSSLYLIDQEKQELWFKVALGKKGNKVKEIRLKIGEGIAGYVAKQGISLNIKDVTKDARFNNEIAQKIGDKQKSMLTTPIKFKDTTIGILQLINKKGGRNFTKQDEALVEGICSQVAIALENAKLYKELRDLFVDTITCLASAIDAKDPYTKGHSQRVTDYAIEIGKEYGLTDSQLDKLEYTALLHDIGKIGIKDIILNKEDTLTDNEYAIMKNHVLIGYNMLCATKSLHNMAFSVKYHHEKYDGTGYCEGISGGKIPLEARIIAVADTYDAMTTTRPYREGLPHEVAMSEIYTYSGKQFDPSVVECFSKIMNRNLVQNAE